MQKVRDAANRQGALNVLVLASVCAGVLSSTARGDETITFYATAFLPTATTITVGETVHFVHSAGSHTVTSGTSSAPSGSPGALFDVELDATAPLFSYTFNTPGTYSFFCRDHETGLVGTIVVEPFFVVVGVVNNAFTPEDVHVFAGDQVRWEWIEGLHSVTSGASSAPADNPGALFDSPLTGAQPVFIHDFTTPGTFPYFCLPHEAFNMYGSVHVQQLFIRGDTNSDGQIDVADPITLLGHLFLQEPEPACTDAADATDDGTLNIADAILQLSYLFGGGTLPAPFPQAGADRSSDALYCY
ncbi:MAG: plastocyanin/azurin family copper-binding protein [Planctomycetota bacterium]